MDKVVLFSLVFVHGSVCLSVMDVTTYHNETCSGHPEGRWRVQTTVTFQCAMVMFAMWLTQWLD